VKAASYSIDDDDDDLMPPPEYFGVTIESELDAEVRTYMCIFMYMYMYVRETMGYFTFSIYDVY
jgi:hypothetical protein